MYVNLNKNGFELGPTKIRCSKCHTAHKCTAYIHLPQQSFRIDVFFMYLKLLFTLYCNPIHDSGTNSPIFLYIGGNLCECQNLWEKIRQFGEREHLYPSTLFIPPLIFDIFSTENMESFLQHGSKNCLLEFKMSPFLARKLVLYFLRKEAGFKFLARKTTSL